jgi:AcrR family transcriptional regulator
MSHREDLLAGAVRCLREKGYARTTARDIVAASGTNLASIGYHYGSTEALLNAAVMQAMDELGAEMAQAMRSGPAQDPDAPVIERFEWFWTHVIDSFRTSAEVWMATFDVFSVAQRNPEVRAAIADGLADGRLLWAQALYGADADPKIIHAVGSLYQALLSGVLVQWLIDPERAPSAADLARALLAITSRLTAQNAKLAV